MTDKKAEIIAALNDYISPPPKDLITDLTKADDVSVINSTINLWMGRTKEDWKDKRPSDGIDIYNALHRKNKLTQASKQDNLGLQTVDLQIYAPRATKKFELLRIESKSGKIHVESLLRDYRWRRLFFLEHKTLLQYDRDGWSLNDGFINGNTYKLRYEIDDRYDESIGFSDATIEKVEKHFNLNIIEGFLPEEEHPRINIPDSLFEQLVLLRKRNSLFSENARRTLISLFLANAIEYADEEGKLLVDEEMTFTCVIEKNGKRIQYNGPVDFAIGHSPVDAKLNKDCALLVVEAKTPAKLGEALGQALAQAAINFIVRKQVNRVINGHLKIYWCISDAESWRFGYITEGNGASLNVHQANTTTCWFHQRHMIPRKEECSKLFSLIVFWIKKAMESSRSTSRRNSESADGFDMETLLAEIASVSIKHVD